MSITIQTFFTVIDGADADTGWTSSGVGEFTGFQREDPGCLGNQASLGFQDPYFTLASIEDYSDRTIFGWERSGNPDSIFDNGFGIIVGDRRRQLASQTINAAGSGYTALDILTVVGGTFLTAATIQVDTVDGGGAILTASVAGAGNYEVDPATPNTPTGGTGSSAIFNLTMADGAVSTRTAFTVGGSEAYGHFVLGWSGFRLDMANLQPLLRDLVGTAANIYTSRIQDVGYSMSYVTKALGNADNVFWDQLTYITNGDPALRILGGTNGSRAKFSNIASADFDTISAYGVMRQLITTNAFELSFGIDFGHPTTDSFFEDSNFQLFINGGAVPLTVMSAGNMDVNLVAGSGTNLFILEDGVIVGISTRSNWDLSAAFETMQFNRLTVSDLGTITFPVTGGTLREANDNIFNNCDQIYLSSITGNGNIFNDTNNPLGAILWDANSVEENQDNLTFISGGSGHAIQISLNTASLTTFNIDGYVVSGYETANDGSTGNTVLIVDNLLDGDVTINVSGGSGTISFERAAGYTGTVTINANVTVTLTGLQNNTEITVFDAGTGAEIAHVEDVVGNEFAFSDAAANVVDIFIHHIAFYRADILNFTIPGAAASIPVKQTSDPNYVND